MACYSCMYAQHAEAGCGGDGDKWWRGGAGRACRYHVPLRIGQDCPVNRCPKLVVCSFIGKGMNGLEYMLASAGNVAVRHPPPPRRIIIIVHMMGRTVAYASRLLPWSFVTICHYFSPAAAAAVTAASHEKAVVKNVPPPTGPTGGPLRALIYDSVYDEYKVWCGVVTVRCLVLIAVPVCCGWG